MTEARPALCRPGFCDGIDISQANFITNPKAVAEAGFVFATVKVSEGVGYCDPKAVENLDRLRDAGLICSVYSFLRPSQGHPRDQVKRAYECAGSVFPGRLALDLEGAPTGMTDGELLSFTEDAIDEAHSYWTLEPELYSFPDFYRRRCMPAFSGSELVARCPWWAADYGPTGKLWIPPPNYRVFTPLPFRTWTKWQYSGNDGFAVPGIAGACDRNLFNGDLAALRAYMGLTADSTPTIRVDVPSRRPPRIEDFATVHPAVDMPTRDVRIPGDDEPPPQAA